MASGVLVLTSPEVDLGTRIQVQNVYSKCGRNISGGGGLRPGDRVARRSFFIRTVTAMSGIT